MFLAILQTSALSGVCLGIFGGIDTFNGKIAPVKRMPFVSRQDVDGSLQVLPLYLYVGWRWMISMYFHLLYIADHWTMEGFFSAL